MKYIALLRGINVGGNKKVPMAELKHCFSELGFLEIVTYINSGNVIFDAPEQEKSELISHCERAIEKKFGFSVICAVISAEEFTKALEKAPMWWNSGEETKYNAMFVVAPATAAQIQGEMSERQLDEEQVVAVEPIVFWSAPQKSWDPARYSKILSAQSQKKVTVRNANTVKKLLELIES